MVGYVPTTPGCYRESAQERPWRQPGPLLPVDGLGEPGQAAAGPADPTRDGQVSPERTMHHVVHRVQNLLDS